MKTSFPSFDSRLGAELEELRRADLFRSLTEIASGPGSHILIGDRKFLNFSSNDYLGLSGDTRLWQAAITAIQEFGMGTGSSRLLCGTQSPHVRLEKKLANFKRKEAALVFTTGYAANVGTISALVGSQDLILSDKWNHASIVDAARLSGATLRVYPHGNLKKLRDLLSSSSPFRRRLIITETVFSMDGDWAPLTEIVKLKEEYDAWLMIDEAHATGIFGENRRGLAELQGIEDRVEITMGTLSKALGAMGGYVVGSRSLIDTLINRARSFIFSTAPPAAICAAAEKAIEIVEGEPERTQRLFDNARFLRTVMQKLNFPVPQNESPIIPLILGDTAAAVAASRLLWEAGIFVPPIRPPTVPRGKARLRFVLSAAHTREDLLQLSEQLHLCVVPRDVAN